MNIFQKIKLANQANNIYEQIQKGQPMTKWLPTLVTFLLGLIGALTPSINSFVTAHPASATIFAAFYAIVKGLLASPLGQKAPQVSGVKLGMISAFLLIGLSAAPAHAQTNMLAAGVSYNSAGSPSVAGTGLYAHTLTDGTMAFTIADAIPTTVKPFTVNVNMGAGIAQRIFSIGKVPIYIPTAAGVSLNGSNTGWSWSTGAMTAFKIKNNWYIMPLLRVSKSSVSNGSGYQPIFGILFAFGQ